MEPNRRTLFDRIFRTREGKIVIGQKPNAPLITWFVSSLLQRGLPECRLRAGAGSVAFASLFIWASLEFFDGVNVFRQAMGLFVLFGMAASRLRR